MQNRTPMTGQQAYQRLTALCARGEHCRHEMLEKMRQWGVSAGEQDEVMARLLSERYVDDERYARAFVRDKIIYNKWGRRKVEQALWAKHIDEQTAQAVLDEVDDREYADILRPLLRQKRRSTRADGEHELTMKLIRFALGRGFTMDIIRQCIEADDADEFSE